MALQKAVSTQWGKEFPTGYFRIREVHWRRPEHDTPDGLLVEIVVDVYIDAAAYAAGGQPVAWKTYTGPLPQDLRAPLYAWLKTVPELTGAQDA